MLAVDPRLSIRLPLISLLGILLLGFAWMPAASAQAAYVRVSQVGYETGRAPFRAYLMSTVAEDEATFKVLNSKGGVAYRGAVGASLGAWSHSKTARYSVYAIDFTIPGGDLYKISVSGPAAATSPTFAVDSPDKLYSGLLLNTLFFYETERDGADYIHNALRDAPGHLKDLRAQTYQAPPLDGNDFIDNVPPVPPLTSVHSSSIDASGGWWDAGDYLKYVETTSYTAAAGSTFPNCIRHQVANLSGALDGTSGGTPILWADDGRPLLRKNGL